MFVDQRSVPFWWVMLMILMLLFSPAQWQLLFHPTPPASTGPSEATTVVEDDGFTLRLAGITISGDADTAATGTTISAELIEPEIPATISDFADPIGTGVEITLGNHEQPATPLTVAFAPQEVAGWYADIDGDPDLMPVVFASNDTDLGVEFADAYQLADGSVIVSTSHLSQLYPGVTSAERFSDRLFDEASVFFGARSEQPGCYQELPAERGWEVTGIPDELFWPCIAESPDSLEIDLQNNSAHVWLISSSQADPHYPPSVLSGTNLLVAAAALQVIDHSTTSPLIPPDASVTFFGDPSADEFAFNAELSPPLTVIHAVLNASLAYVPGAKLEKILQGVGTAECLIGILQEAMSTEIDASFVRTVLGCVGTLVGGLAGNVFSSVSAVPGAAVSFLDGARRSIAGTDSFTFTVSRYVEPSSTGASAWPTGRDDGPGILYTWLGANMYGFPDWVACDDAQDYCLVGFDGAEHLLVDMNALEPMYWLADWIEDPREALLSVGLPEHVVDEILGD